MNTRPCEACGRNKNECDVLGTCLVDIVPRDPNAPTRVLCLPCWNAAFAHQSKAVAPEREARRASHTRE